jgi:hypothetical protein
VRIWKDSNPASIMGARETWTQQQIAQGIRAPGKLTIPHHQFMQDRLPHILYCGGSLWMSGPWVSRIKPSE